MVGSSGSTGGVNRDLAKPRTRYQIPVSKSSFVFELLLAGDFVGRMGEKFQQETN